MPRVAPSASPPRAAPSISAAAAAAVSVRPICSSRRQCDAAWEALLNHTSLAVTGAGAALLSAGGARGAATRAGPNRGARRASRHMTSPRWPRSIPTASRRLRGRRTRVRRRAAQHLGVPALARNPPGVLRLLRPDDPRRLLRARDERAGACAPRFDADARDRDGGGGGCGGQSQLVPPRSRRRAQRARDGGGGRTTRRARAARRRLRNGAGARQPVRGPRGKRQHGDVRAGPVDRLAVKRAPTCARRGWRNGCAGSGSDLLASSSAGRRMEDGGSRWRRWLGSTDATPVRASSRRPPPLPQRRGEVGGGLAVSRRRRICGTSSARAGARAAGGAQQCASIGRAAEDSRAL